MPTAPRRTRAATASRWLGVAGVAIGAIVLAGHAFGWDPLTRLHSTWESMKPTTAAALLTLGAILAAGRGGQTRLPIRAAGVAVLAVAVGSLIERTSDLHVGLRWVSNKPGDAGLMALATAVSLVALSTALLVMTVARRVAELLAASAGAIGYLGLVGYAIDVEGLYGVGAWGSMALHTAIAVVALSVAVLAAVPQGIVATVDAADDPGSVLLRRVVPVTLVMPPALTSVTLAASRADLWTESFARAVDLLLLSTMLVAIVTFAAQRIRGLDDERAHSLRLADEDPLTGVANRRAFDRIARGHAAGDLLLRRVASVLSDHTRLGDVVARLGGDEFAVLLPEASERDAVGAASKMAAIVSSDLGDDASVSIGIGVCDESVSSLDELLLRADLALYEAKASGKNRCYLFPTDERDAPRARERRRTDVR